MKCPIAVPLLSPVCGPLHWGLGLGDSSLNPVEPPMVITYLIVLSCLRVDDGKSLIAASYGQKIYICTKTLHYLSQRAPPTQTNNALNQQIPGTVLWLHNTKLPFAKSGPITKPVVVKLSTNSPRQPRIAKSDPSLKVLCVGPYVPLAPFRSVAAPASILFCLVVSK